MKRLFLLLALLGGVGTAVAAGNIEAGASKSVICAACHGSDGNSQVALYPNIAGQSEAYIVSQLIAFKAGDKSGRYDPVMAGMVMSLSEQDMLDLAAFYASQKASSGTTPKSVVETAENLYRGGDLKREIAACSSCHGPRGNGMSLAGFPKISGQHPEYIKKQLLAFRNFSESTAAGEYRANDPKGMMRDVAARLTDKEIEALSQYLFGLH